eukprot:Seg4175.3 transcript_id=Seg4175.3/GoldUCD/mRNA.D3Y31 product="hypothetical protein" protein_id=Seg4175.3/GoldUCD/D3Y31
MAEQTLKRCRSAHRMNIRKQMRDAQACIDDNSRDNTEMLKLKVELTSKLEKIVKLDEQIVMKLCEDDAIGEDAIAVETEEADELATGVRTILIKLDGLLTKKSTPTSPRRVLPMLPNSPSAAGRPSSPAGGSFGHTGPQAAVFNKARLPKLEMKRFNGDICHWQEFWDCFESSIDSDQDLPPVMKLNYLRGLLDGPAKAVITGYETTNANYAEALDVLKDRYGKKSVIQLAHLNGIMNHAAVKDEDDIVGLRKFQDTIEVHYRGLRALGVDEETYCYLLVEFISKY